MGLLSFLFGMKKLEKEARLIVLGLDNGGEHSPCAWVYLSFPCFNLFDNASHVTFVSPPPTFVYYFPIPNFLTLPAFNYPWPLVLFRQNDNTKAACKWRYTTHCPNTRLHREVFESEWIQAQCVGYWGSEEHTALLEELLQLHKCRDLCNWQFRSSQNGRNRSRVESTFGRGKTGGNTFASLC